MVVQTKTIKRCFYTIVAPFAGIIMRMRQLIVVSLYMNADVAWFLDYDYGR